MPKYIAYKNKGHLKVNSKNKGPLENPSPRAKYKNMVIDSSLARQKEHLLARDPPLNLI